MEKLKNREVFDLFIAWVTISLAFAFVLSAMELGALPIVVPMVMLTVGLGFILHELAHKYVAIHYGCHAEFRMWTMGLVIAILLSITVGFVFAAPGAVYIFGKELSRKKNGIISIAGPVVNILLAIGFFSLAFIAASKGFLHDLGMMGFRINLFLAAFNMLPIPPLDGSKVFFWSKGIWAIIFIPLAIIILFSMFRVF